MNRNALSTFVLLLLSAPLSAAEVARGPVYAPVEIAFAGPEQEASDAPARDVEFWVRFRHESGAPEYRVFGFFDGDGKGGRAGDIFKARFSPTKPGRWELAEVHSNAKELNGQRQGNFVTAAPSELPGFWEVDADSPGKRWFRRSDGSHPYIFGNTHYSFLSGRKRGGEPTGVDVATDVEHNAQYFKKLRFGLGGDRYPDPEVKPFLDDAGKPTDSGDYSHRPNPEWFAGRVDVAVRAAFENDLIADLILAGPDTEATRSTLRAARNGGDATPFLRYVAARYGSYPNVWVCLSNEFEIKSPRYDAKEIARLGRAMADFLPYPTPLSVHPDGHGHWPAPFDELPGWNTHLIIQRKLRHLGPSADVIRAAHDAGDTRRKPTVNDELSYQGEGDRHTEGDTIEAHLGAFLGGGYASSGYKPGNKTGHYFWGAFDPSEHTAADNLRWLRAVIDRDISYWKMAPDGGIFPDLPDAFRALGWPGDEYALGTSAGRKGLVAELPEGEWTVTLHDAVAMKSRVLSERATGRFTFDAPAARAVLFHFKRNSGGEK